MNEKEKIEIFRGILNNGINMHYSDEVLLKISQKLDKYIVDYIKKDNERKNKRDGKS